MPQTAVALKSKSVELNPLGSFSKFSLQLHFDINSFCQEKCPGCGANLPEGDSGLCSWCEQQQAEEDAKEIQEMEEEQEPGYFGF